MKQYLALGLVACMGISQNAFAQSKEEVIRVGNLKLAHFAAISYIKEIQKDCGIRVEERIFAKGPDIMQGVLAGEIDIGASASEATVAARASGLPIFVVAGFAKGGARLVAQPGLNIKSVKDLKGKKVGVTRGSIQEVLLAAELGKHNLSSSERKGKDVLLVYLGYPDLNQALLTKHIDAMLQSEPYSSQALAKGFGVEVIKPYDTDIGEPVRTLVMTEKFYKERRPLAEKFMRCFVKATKTFIDKPEVAEKYVTQTIFKGQLTKAEFKDAIDNSPYSYDITVDHIQKTTDLMAKHGIGRMKTPAKAIDWVKTDLLDEAKKELGVK
ncbi:putative aliphatic sulfonates-binding protein precursor [compost metagenome]